MDKPETGGRMGAVVLPPVPELTEFLTDWGFPSPAPGRTSRGGGCRGSSSQ